MPGVALRPHNLTNHRDYSEGWEYISPDGQVYKLDRVAGRYVISWEGDGLSPVEYISQRGPFQHGETPQDFFLRPRIIQMAILRKFDSRQGWWDGRHTLLDEIRPNRQAMGSATPGTLRVIRPDGSRRAIDVFIQQGPNFSPRDPAAWQEHSFREVLRWIAFNPVWYDPTQQSLTFSLIELANLVFPITFPIILGSSSINSSQNLTYLGTWIEYPTILITGPLNNPSITNSTTGETIALTYNVAAGEVVTITLGYGNKTVTSSLGSNLIGNVNSTSDLATFHIAPNPEAAAGVNVINVVGSAATPATSIVMRYYRRYIGI